MLKSLRVIAPIVGAAAVSIALSIAAHADADDPLLGSTNAIFLGGTAEPTPSIAYVEAADQLFLQPLGFGDGASICDMAGNLPCDGSLQVLTTPEVFEFGPSSLQDETNLVYGIEAEYHAGLMSPSDPLTVFAYSQSAIAASAAEKMLAADGIPKEDLHFVFIGDPSDANGIATNIYADLIQLFGGGTTGTTLTNDILTAINEDQFAPGGLLAGYTPGDLYPTTIYTIDTDGVADWQEDWNAVIAGGGSPLDALGNGLYHFFTTHVEYLGLTPEEVASGVATTTGLTTTITIPDGSDMGAIINDGAALLGAFSHGVADSGAITALLETVEDLFNPAYF
jgi:PE-PPE domain